MGIARPVMEVHPWAWGFFVPFILVATFTMLNLFIAIIVSTMQSMVDEENRQETEAINAAVHDDTSALIRRIDALHEEVRGLRAELAKTRAE